MNEQELRNRLSKASVQVSCDTAAMIRSPAFWGWYLLGKLGLSWRALDLRMMARFVRVK